MLYSEIVWENYKNPQNNGKLENADIVFEDFNPKCGDKITWYLKLNDGVIEDTKFEASGCALSIAGASIVSEELKGKNIGEILSMDENDLWEVLGFQPYPGRILCSTLGFMSLKKAIEYNRVRNQKTA